MKRLAIASAVMEVTAWLTAILGIIAGIAIGAHADHPVSLNIIGQETGTTTTHPFIAVGVGIAIAALLWSLLLFWLASLGHAYVETHD
jgi:tetrahydromethanopterin S-methyltransferase subunit E